MHQMSNSRPLLCRELIGREHELQELREALQQAARGQPQFVLLAGEAGVGKTKLCRVFVEASQAQQALILFGQAISQDQALPFAPFLDAFRRYFSTSPGQLTLSDPSLPATFAFLSQLLPELTSLFPEVTPLVFEVSSTPVQRQQVLFHYVLSGLQALAQAHGGPVVLILEDLHWADETSLELLAFLSSRVAEHTPSATLAQADHASALMVLGTYRVEALPDRPALQRLLSQLYMQRQGHEVRLSPLAPSDHWRCVSSILRNPVPEAFARFLFDWDEGNPFFTEELLGAMAATGQLAEQSQGWLIRPGTKPHLPASLAAAILERFLSLPATDQEVLFYAAVIGRTFDFPLLAALCRIDERELVGVLRRAMNAQLISEVNSALPEHATRNEQERYQFRHALTREAIYHQLLAPECRLHHRTVAEILEQLATDAPTSGAAPALRRDNLAQLLAEHYWLAGLPEKARPYALHEADRASRLFAFREERYYLNMVQASQPQESLERFQILERIGMLSVGLYDLADALDWLRMAQAGYQRVGQPYLELKALANMLAPSWLLANRSVHEMLAEVEAAAEIAFARADSAQRGMDTLVISSIIAKFYLLNCHHHSATRWLELSFSIYESLNDPGKDIAIQGSFLTQGWIEAHQHITRAEEGIAKIREVLKNAYLHRLPDLILHAYTILASILVHWGHSDEVEQVTEEMTDFEALSGGLCPADAIGWQCFFSGERWDQGIERLNTNIKRLERMNVPRLITIDRVVLAHILLARNELAQAQIHLQNAQPMSELTNDYCHLIHVWWGFAKLCTAQGDLPGARVWYERSLNRWKTTEDTFTIIPILLDGIVFYAESGNRVKARQWLAELEAVVQVTENPVGVAALLEAQGVVYARERRLQQAIAALQQAVEAWPRLKRGYQQALASQRLAEALLTWAGTEAVGRSARQAAREEADRLLDQARAVYERLQIPTGRAAIDALRSSTHLQAQRKRRRTLEARHASHGLTEREVQVLLQLAAGKTNKEIAAALSLSIGTVELHVSHILGKLDCETRTQAVAYAIATGWVNGLST